MFQNRPEHLAPLSEVIDTGKREGTAAYNTVKGMVNPMTYYHALADEPTAEEKKLIGDHGTVGNIAARPGLALARLSSEPLAHAAVKGVDIARSPDPVGEALKVAPEAIGTGAGLAVGGKLIGNAAEGTKALIKDPSWRTAGEATGVSPTIRATGRVLKNPAVSHLVGPAAITAATSGLGLPVAGAIGATEALIGERMGVPKMIEDAGQRMAETGLSPMEKLRTRLKPSPIRVGSYQDLPATPEAAAGVKSGLLRAAGDEAKGSDLTVRTLTDPTTDEKIHIIDTKDPSPTINKWHNENLRIGKRTSPGTVKPLVEEPTVERTPGGGIPQPPSSKEPTASQPLVGEPKAPPTWEEKLRNLNTEPVVRQGVGIGPKQNEPLIKTEQEAPVEEPKLSGRPDKAVHQKVGASDSEIKSLHEISNAELGELATRGGVNMGTLKVGRAKGYGAAEQISRADVFQKLYDLGLKPADILKLRSK